MPSKDSSRRRRTPVMEQLASSDRTSVSDVSSSATVEPSSAKEMWQSGPPKQAASASTASVLHRTIKCPRRKALKTTRRCSFPTDSAIGSPLYPNSAYAIAPIASSYRATLPDHLKDEEILFVIESVSIHSGQRVRDVLAEL